MSAYSTHPLAPYIPTHPIPNPPPISFLHHPYHSSSHALPGRLLPRAVRRCLPQEVVFSDDEEPLDGMEKEVGVGRRLIAIINPSTVLHPRSRTPSSSCTSSFPTTTPNITPARGQKLFYTEVVRQILAQVEDLERAVDGAGGDSANGRGAGDKGVNVIGNGKLNGNGDGSFKPDRKPSPTITTFRTFILTLADLQARHHRAQHKLSKSNQSRKEDPDPSSVVPSSSNPNVLLIILDAHALPALLGPVGWAGVINLPELGRGGGGARSVQRKPELGESPGHPSDLPPLTSASVPTLALSLILTSPRSWSDDLILHFLNSGATSAGAAVGMGSVPEGVVRFFLQGIGRDELITSLLPPPDRPTHPLLPHFIHHLLASSLSLVPFDAIPTIRSLARPLWKVYTANLVEHAEDWMIGGTFRSGRSVGEVEGRSGERAREEDEMYVDEREDVSEADRALTRRERKQRDAPGQDLKPFLRITNPLLLELKSRTKHAFQAANDGLLPGLVSEERFLDVFLPERAAGLGKEGRADRELDELGLQGEERERARAFYEMMPASGNSVVPESTTNLAGSTSNAPAKQRRILLHHLDYLVPLRPTNPFSHSGPIANGGKPTIPKPSVPRLPLFARYLLLAAYCASYNSPRSDLRMFGRGPVGSLKRKVDHNGQISYEATAGGGAKKKGGGTRKVRLGGTSKVPQSLLGPKAFGLDRMLAIFMALLVEHGWDAAMEARAQDDEDFDSEEDELDGQAAGVGDLIFDEEETILTAKRRDRMRKREERRKADWEDEVEEISRSVGLFGLIPELEKLRFLRRVSPRDRLDNIQIRCEAPREYVVEYARTLKIDLAAYLVDGE